VTAPTRHTSQETTHPRSPTAIQRRWLARGIAQAGGKLPLFDEHGRSISAQTIRSCIRKGWAEPWIHNPIKPDWLVCKLTPAGREALGRCRSQERLPDDASR